MTLTVPLQRAATFRNDPLGEPRPMLALEHLENWTGALVEGARLGEAEAGQPGVAAVEPGDVLFGKLRPYLAKGMTISEPLAASTELVCMRPTPDMHPRYLGYVTRSVPFVEWSVASSEGTKMPRTSWEKLREFHVTREQRAIADFLDTETARIDALITKKRRMIELLKERVATDAIETIVGRKQGVDLAPTGIDWLGDVPRGWEITRLTRVARLESGHTPSRTRDELWKDADKNWITLNDVGALKNSEFISETMNLISDAGLAASSARMLPAQTVVLSRDATIGRTGIMTKPMATSQHFAAWVCGDRVDPRYVWAVLTYPMQTYLARFDDGATLRTIGMPYIRKFVSPIPPIDTQRSIVRELEELRTEHNSLAASLEGQVGLLAEKRQALITAAVTGELEIPVAA